MLLTILKRMSPSQSSICSGRLARREGAALWALCCSLWRLALVIWRLPAPGGDCCKATPSAEPRWQPARGMAMLAAVPGCAPRLRCAKALWPPWSSLPELGPYPNHCGDFPRSEQADRRRLGCLAK
jgi:hypothetical protein